MLASETVWWDIIPFGTTLSQGAKMPLIRHSLDQILEAYHDRVKTASTEVRGDVNRLGESQAAID